MGDEGQSARSGTRYMTGRRQRGVMLGYVCSRRPLSSERSILLPGQHGEAQKGAAIHAPPVQAGVHLTSILERRRSRDHPPTCNHTSRAGRSMRKLGPMAARFSSSTATCSCIEPGKILLLSCIARCAGATGKTGGSYVGGVSSEPENGCVLTASPVLGIGLRGVSYQASRKLGVLVLRLRGF